MIHTEIINNIGIITLCRPHVHNAMNEVMMLGIQKTLAEWKEDDEVKMLVITGEGEASFCSGGDLEEFHGLDTNRLSELFYQMSETLYQIHTFPKPTVAALNGHALGGGCELAVSCDFRLAKPSSKLGFIQITLGIPSGWGGGTRLFSLLPRSKAMKMVLTGEKIEATEALELGLVDDIIQSESFRDDIIAWCNQITVHPLPAILAYKQTFVVQQNANLSVKEKIRLEVGRCLALRDSEEHRQAIATFLSSKKKKK